MFSAGDWTVIMIQLFVATVIKWAGHSCSQLNAHHLGNIKHTTILTSSCNAGCLLLLFKFLPRTIMTTSDNITVVSWEKLGQRG